jgi:hypothetical protein
MVRPAGDKHEFARIFPAGMRLAGAVAEPVGRANPPGELRLGGDASPYLDQVRSFLRKHGP